MEYLRWDDDYLRPYGFVDILGQMVNLLALSEGPVEVFARTDK